MKALIEKYKTRSSYNILFKKDYYPTYYNCNCNSFAQCDFLLKQHKCQTWNKQIAHRFYYAHLFDLYAMAHAEDVEDQAACHDGITANDPWIEILTPEADIVLPCSSLQQHLRTSCTKDR